MSIYFCRKSVDNVVKFICNKVFHQKLYIVRWLFDGLYMTCGENGYEYCGYFEKHSISFELQF